MRQEHAWPAIATMARRPSASHAPQPLMACIAAPLDVFCDQGKSTDISTQCLTTEHRGPSAWAAVWAAV